MMDAIINIDNHDVPGILYMRHPKCTHINTKFSMPDAARRFFLLLFRILLLHVLSWSRGARFSISRKFTSIFFFALARAVPTPVLVRPTAILDGQNG